jgi:hypothetical protein
MAYDDKDIVVTPNKGAAGAPQITLTSADAGSNTSISIVAAVTGTTASIIFNGSVGDLLSISATTTGTLFGVNDASGIPSLEVMDDGTVRLAQYGGNVGVGTASPSYKLDVVGTLEATEFIGVFPVGTAMLFVQSAAPTGWVKSTAHDDKALRVVSGTAATGGSTAFTSVFASRTPAGTVGSTTLTAAQTGVPAHSHNVSDPSHKHTLRNDPDTAADGGVGLGAEDLITAILRADAMDNALTGISINDAAAAAAAEGHTHTFTGTALDFAVSYVDVIIATKA